MIIWLKNVNTILMKSLNMFLQKSLLNRLSIVHGSKTLTIKIIIIIIIVFCLVVIGRRAFFCFPCQLYFFPNSLLSSLYPLLLFLCLISFLLFPCASVWENTRAWVPHFLLPCCRMVLVFFPKVQLQVHNVYSAQRSRNTLH